MAEHSEPAVESRFGFRWGNVWVQRRAHIPGRGRVVVVGPEDTETRVEVYVSEGGRSVRVWKNGVEMFAPDA